MVLPTPATVVKPFVKLLVSAFRRRRCAEARLLQSTLENIGEGLSVFDSRGRLIAWNSRFCELLELPPDLPVGVPLRDILMLQAVRGDFGRDDPSVEVATGRLEHEDVAKRRAGREVRRQFEQFAETRVPCDQLSPAVKDAQTFADILERALEQPSFGTAPSPKSRC